MPRRGAGYEGDFVVQGGGRDEDDLLRHVVRLVVVDLCEVWLLCCSSRCQHEHVSMPRVHC